MLQPNKLEAQARNLVLPFSPLPLKERLRHEPI
jgi:hypothetical protein